MAPAISGNDKSSPKRGTIKVERKHYTGCPSHRSDPELYQPHEFQTELVATDASEPLILLAPDVWSDLYPMAKSVEYNELGMLGTVRKSGNVFLIDRIFVPKQKVHGATCELTEDGLAELAAEILQEDPDLMEMLRFWGHFHLVNYTLPSAQDEDQMADFSHNDWFIRGIFGKTGGRAEFAFYDYRRGVHWTDVPWRIHHPIKYERENYWKAMIGAKTEKIPAPAPSAAEEDAITGAAMHQVYQAGYDEQGRLTLIIREEGVE